MGDMSLSALRVSLQEALMGASSKFTTDEQLDRCLNTALEDLPRVKPLVLRDSLTMVADQTAYTCPAGLLKPLMLEWGADVLRTIKPWDANWPGRLPDIAVGYEVSTRKLLLAPAPTAAQITALGATAYYRYSGRYTLADPATNTTISPDDRELFIIRALAEAMFMLSRDGVSKPVMVGKAGFGGMPKNGMPSVLAGELINLYQKMAGKG